MVIDMTLVLWLIMLVLLTQLIPVAGKWGKLMVWAGLVLITVVLVLTKVLVLK